LVTTFHGAPLFGGHPVHPGFVPTLEAVLKGLTHAERKQIKDSVSQGWALPSPWSANTHADGFAVDFLTAGWPEALIRKVVRLFRRHGCQAVLRLSGERLSRSSPPVSVEHIHAIHNGHGNAKMLSIVTAPGGYRHIERELAKRRTG